MYTSISLASLHLTCFCNLHNFPKQKIILHSQTPSEATTHLCNVSHFWTGAMRLAGAVSGAVSSSSQQQQFVARMRFLHTFLPSSSICVTFMRFLYLDNDPKLIPYPHLDRCYRTAYLIGTTHAHNHICTCNTEQITL